MCKAGKFGEGVITWNDVCPQLDVMHDGKQHEQDAKHHVHPVKHLHAQHLHDSLQKKLIVGCSLHLIPRIEP